MIHYHTRSFKSYLKIMFKKILIFSIFIFISNTTFGAQNCEIIRDEFEKYQCRSQKVCETYNENKKVFQVERFRKAESYKESSISNVLFSSNTPEKIIQKAVSVYKENMNSTYKCALLVAQKNSLQRIRQKLLSLDKTLDIKRSFEPKLQNMLQQLDEASQKSQCLHIDQHTVFNKLSILRQTTYLTCDYHFYMEYLKTYYNNPSNALWINSNELEKYDEKTKSYTMIEAANKITTAKNSIEREINHAYKVFPIVYHAYSEYENNFPIHFLLSLLKEDYYVFRNKLHEVLNPINQVVYKISNAMKE